MRRSALIVSVAVLVGGASACSPGSVGTGSGAVDGAVFIRQCASRNVGSETGDNYSYGTLAAPLVYDMKPTFFTAEPVNDFDRLYPQNRLEIRVQSDGARVEEADVLFLNLASDDLVAQALNTPILVGPTTNVRASLELNQSCPMPEVAPTLEGSITFTSFGNTDGQRVPISYNIGIGDRLAASFDFRIVDVRAATLGGIGAVSSTPAVAGDLTGFFDFIVRRGQSGQSYP